MMRRTVVLNVVGLTRGLLGRAMPRLSAFARAGESATIRPAFPALTCTAQSCYLTGLPPARHGIVGNGWYDRDLAEVHFWKQSNHLVAGPKLWDKLRGENPAFTCAQLFWWYNMHAAVDYSITPRPLYPADGRKIFDIHTEPFSLRPEIKKELGEFPFTRFWGPGAGIDSSRWIAAAARWIEERHEPTLSLVYLPHLDYNLQRLGPGDPKIEEDLRLADDLAGDLIDFFQKRSVQVAVLSEYGITDVDTPVHLNRLFRRHGWLAIKDELGLETLDCGASRVFAVADHQVAHIYLNDPALESKVRSVLESEPGVELVLDGAVQMQRGIAHRRGGDFVVVARPRSWFTYYYWEDDALAPDFARTVDIHRKIGYDPAELFLDPKLRWPGVRIVAWLLRKKLGFRGLLDVVPLDAALVRGSHGRCPEDENDRPILLLERPRSPAGAGKSFDATEVHDELLRYIDPAGE
ncbi:MAG TPA: nucleotide pyrophosphatase/phosphodiesterase family protein [Candidatus Methylacidiphilales bacterium]|jgi:predicted AlkP superfamily pyrophosphatase or phosphodiesterase|nr:nucleotide pyrophosphatase/phosphodiesterase family protein [Candidatus Methylacidiphilales bacterium]